MVVGKGLLTLRKPDNTSASGHVNFAPKLRNATDLIRIIIMQDTHDNGAISNLDLHWYILP